MEVVEAISAMLLPLSSHKPMALRDICGSVGRERVGKAVGKGYITLRLNRRTNREAGSQQVVAETGD